MKTFVGELAERVLGGQSPIVVGLDPRLSFRGFRSGKLQRKPRADDREFREDGNRHEKTFLAPVTGMCDQIR